jgi:hypothetical protein
MISLPPTEGEVAYSASWIASACLSGGSGVGPEGMWTDGDVCAIRFPAWDDPEVGVLMTGVCGALGPRWPQVADIYVGGFLVAHWEVVSTGLQEAIIPRDIHEGRGFDVLIVLDRPVCLLELGVSEDFRRLGLLLQEIRFASHAPVRGDRVPD